MIGRDTLQCTDFHRLALLGAAHAGAFAENFRGAYACTAAAKDVRIQDLGRRTIEVSGGDATDEARDIDTRRASGDTGRIEAEIAPARLDLCLIVSKKRFYVGEVGKNITARASAGGRIW